MSFYTKHKDQPTLTALTDEQLVRQILLTQARTAQEELYKRYAERVYNKCLHIVKDREIAKDLTHDVMIKVFTQLKKYAGKSPFYGWIFAITYNHCMDYLKRKQKIRFTAYEEHNVDQEDDNTGLEQKILLELKFEQLDQSFRQLSERERLLLLMRYQDGMSIRQMAIVLQVSESALKMRLKRSRDHLAKLVKSADYDE